MAGPWRVRTRKPRGNARVNFSHPLARNIAFFYFEPSGGAAGTFYDAVTGRRHGIAAGISQSASGLSFNGSASSQGTAFANPSAADTTQTTVIARVRPTVKPASKAIFVEFGASGGSRGACLVVDSNGFIGGGGLGSGGEVIQYDAIDHTNQWVTVGGSGDGSSSANGKAWVNGASTGVNIGGGSFSGQAIAEVSLGRQNSGYFQFLTGDLEYVIGFTRILSDAEHLAIARNPWQLLQPANDFGLFSLPAAGGGSDLTLALTGLASTAAVGTLGKTSLLSLGLSGNAATGAVGSVTVPGDKTLALTGSGGTASVGSVAVGLGQALSGNAGTSAINSLGKASLSTIGLTGNFSTGSVGTISVTAAGNKTFALSGVSALCAVGNITISGGNVWNPVAPITTIWTAQLPVSTPWTVQ